jgi:leucyl-tRNA synthetase
MPAEWEKIEEKWRNEWEKARLFEADPDPKRKKFFVTFPYPYMNGPLHIGHGFTATRVDVYARFMRMKGYNTLFPWAWHWTGEPIVGAAIRVQKGDPEIIKAFKEVDGVPEEELRKFVDPVYMANYYTREGKEAVKRIGLSVDWRREFHTTSLEPTYNRFIEWQYEALKEKGYVAKGTHPVVWCSHCESPTGDHDRLEGEGVSPEEYTLLKFQYGDAFLPAATFRPETIFGVTNMFINPDAAYVKADVDGEKWIVSKEATKKLSEQLKKVKILSEFKGAELIGKSFTDPVSKRKLPILPGWFVSPDSATGVVYSVPAHAPADWIALKDLIGKPEELRRFGIDPEIVKGIKPISLISLEGYGEFPAVEIVEQMGVKDQFDPRVDEATSTIYRKEFHTGILKPVTGKYSGKRVQEVKAELVGDFRKANIADSMYDLPEKVVCRCTTTCIVKILSDQWFLRYSDPEWKKVAHEAVDEADIFPEAARSYFHDKLDWLHDWACARRTGLGTPLPWSPGWIVETLSDSTVYMAFYTIIKHIRHYGIKPEQLTRTVFDYVFYGRGNAETLSKSSGVPAKVLQEMREEFEYWYPVDMRVSAKELVPNHLSFYFFQHTALFPKRHWPRGVGVNGMLSIEGQKMSKSKGNFLTLRSTLNQYGADVTRLTLVLGAEDMDDPDWREENAKSIDARLRALQRFVGDLAKLSENAETRSVDRWLISMVQKRIKTVTSALEVLKTRTAAEVALFEVWNDIRWYMRRAETPNNTVLREVADVWVRLVAPFTPHLSEEMWRLLGKKGFVSLAEWPVYDDSKIDVSSEESEDYIRSLIDDTISIVKATKLSPKRICYYASSNWKWKAYLEVLRMSLAERLEMKNAMKSLMSIPELRKKAKDLATYVAKIIPELTVAAEDTKKRKLQAGLLDEKGVLEEAKVFLQKEFGAEVSIFVEDDPDRYDPKNRASLAKPYRPAIFIE